MFTLLSPSSLCLHLAPSLPPPSPAFLAHTLTIIGLNSDAIKGLAAPGGGGGEGRGGVFMPLIFMLGTNTN
jgi:hypothetical protein